MKQITITGLIILTVVALSRQIVQAQGSITYLSNLSDPSSGSVAVGSDSWLAGQFISGNNAGGYVLNSVELAMTDASGSPSDFTVMLYTEVGTSAGFPGSSLGTLSGSLSPVTAGNYTYTASTDLALSPNTYYCVVVTAGTTVANGAYDWSVTSTATGGYNSYHWGGEVSLFDSSDGLNWNEVSGSYGQFAINATAVPEPGVLGLFALGGLLFVRRRWIKSAT